jgi:hypothetical protein
MQTFICISTNHSAEVTLDTKINIATNLAATSFSEVGDRAEFWSKEDRSEETAVKGLNAFAGALFVRVSGRS